VTCFLFLPAPLNAINLLFPPTGSVISSTTDGTGASFGLTRLSAFATTAGTVANFMLVKYGLRGIFSALHPGRILLFLFMVSMTMLGGFRLTLIGFGEIFMILFFLEGMYRTRMLLVFIIGGLLTASLLVPFADKLPFTFQRRSPFCH